MTHPPGHLWRDKWTALSGPLSGTRDKRETYFRRKQSTVTQVNRGSNAALRRSTLDFCLGGQQRESSNTVSSQKKHLQNRNSSRILQKGNLKNYCSKSSLTSADSLRQSLEVYSARSTSLPGKYLKPVMDLFGLSRPWSQPSGISMVSLVNCHINAARIG